ncbi:protein kinase domain-containing protein [Limnoglobus roseus]|uniref:Serine/threonine protein kinase n=1 Tax=Limnoglobus roseus TaxID=2598579 RepID=A0A5C1AL21_9BACT|nr:protein kinase [Limnoglobus roseus]QEL17588.1 serine/threonine protein kinase [Limnoglobus roseus]
MSTPSPDPATPDRTRVRPDTPPTQEFSADSTSPTFGSVAPPPGGVPEYPFLSPPERSDELGRLGDYRILKKLGEGGMGFVFRGHDPALNRDVALKVMRPEVASKPQAADRFLREGRAAAGLKSDHVITIYQVGRANGVPFLAMEFLEGLPLDVWVKAQKKAVPLPQALRVVRDTLRGLASAHDKGLIHRDIKPANLWIEKGTLRIKVLDFGLTRSNEADEQLTQEGAVVGTPAFMAPEQASGKPVDPRADLFSVGVVMYTLLAGKNPFARGSLMETLGAVGFETQPPVATARPDVPREYSDFLDRLLMKGPDGRPANAKAALQELAAVEKKLQDAAKTVTPSAVGVPLVAIPVSDAAPQVWNELTEKDDVIVRPGRGEPPPPRSSPAVEALPGAPGKPPSKNKLITAGGLFAFLIALGGIVIVITNKDGTKTTVEVPDGAKVEVQEGGKTVASVGPKPAAPPRPGTPPGGTDTPVAVGPSPFDKLDPAAVPGAERFPWQPKELVGVVGSHARRGWWPHSAAAVSPDGSLAATCGVVITLWDLKARTPKAVIPIHNAAPGDRPQTWAWFADGGKKLLCHRAGDWPQLQSWDVTGPTPVLVPIGAGGKAEPLSFPGNFHPVEDGRTVVVFGDGNLRLHDLRGPNPTVAGQEVPATAFAVPDAANVIVYTGPDGRTHRATVRDAKLTADEVIEMPALTRLWMPISADGKKLARWGGKGFEVWDVSAKVPAIVHRIPAQPDVWEDSRLEFSPDGRWLVARHARTALFRLDGPEPTRKAVVDDTDPPGSVVQCGIAFPPDGKQLVLANANGLVRFWDLTGAEPKEQSPMGPDAAVGDPALDPQSGRLFVRPLTDRGDAGVPCVLWDLAAARPAAVARFVPQGWAVVRPLSGERCVLLASDVQAVGQAYRRAGTTFEPSGDPLPAGAAPGGVSPDGRTAVVFANADKPADTRLEGWDLSTAAPRQLWSLPAADARWFKAVTFSADGRWFTTQVKGEKDDGPWTLAVWRNTGTRPERAFALPVAVGGGAHRAALSPDGRYLAHTPTHVGDVVLIDLSGPRPREVGTYSDKGRMGYVAALAFHPDGTKLAWGGDHGVGVLDLATLRPAWDWQAPGPVDAVAWAADGRHLVTHNGNQTAYVLRLPPAVLRTRWKPTTADEVDLLALDPKAATVPTGPGGWAWRDGKWATASSREQLAAVTLPFLASGSYTLTLEATLDEGSEFLGVALPVGPGRGVTFGFNAHQGTVSSFARVNGDGDDAPGNPTVRTTTPLATGKRVAMTLTVRREGGRVALSAAVGGYDDIRWEGPAAALSLPPGENLPSGQVSLLSWGCRWTVHALKYKRIDGTAYTQAAADQDPDRRAAEAVVRGGGSVRIGETWHYAAGTLPAGPFKTNWATLGAADNPRTSDADLDLLRPLSDLKDVNVFGPVTDAGLARLATFEYAPEWRQLKLMDSRVTDDGLKALPRLAALGEFAVDRAAGFTGAGLVHLAGMKLSAVGLAGTGVRDAELAHLKQLPHLHQVWLAETGVTDAGLESLASIKTLKLVHVKKTNVTAAGVKKLQAALPGCSVVSDFDDK